MLNISSSFMEYIKNIDYLSYHFKGPEFNFSKNYYQAVFALFDPQTSEIGTWESYVFFPDLEKNKKRMILNCVMGDVTPNSKTNKKIFSLSGKDGGLEYENIKFYPKVTNQFKQWEGASVFIQICLPSGKIDVQPEFSAVGEDKFLNTLQAELLAETWTEKADIWSGIYKLELFDLNPGENSLYVVFPEKEDGDILNKEIKFSIIR